MSVPETSPAVWLLRNANLWPERPALVSASESITHGALQPTIATLCKRLVSVGLNPGSALAVVSAKNQDLSWSTYLALYCGYPLLALNPKLEIPEDLLAMANVRQAIVDRPWWNRIQVPALKIPTRWLRPEPGEGLPPRPLPEDAVQFMISTSGTQGAPRGVMLSGVNIRAAIEAARDRVPLQPEDIWLACLPMYHIGGLMVILRCLQAGATLLVVDDFNPEETWELMHRFSVTHISLVPAMLANLLDYSADAHPPASLRVALVGGGPLSAAVARRASAAGWEIFATYGMSETSSQVATRRIPRQGWQPGDMGFPLTGVRVEIRDQNGQPTDGTGRIHVTGPSVMVGYLNREMQAGFGLTDGGFTTGDLGYIDNQGHLHVIGRADETIVTGGENVHPAIVEGRLMGCPGVSDVAITGEPDPVWGQRLVALVVGEIEAGELVSWCRSHLPSPWRPRTIIKVEQLPRNGLGKLFRPGLANIRSLNPRL